MSISRFFRQVSLFVITVSVPLSSSAATVAATATQYETRGQFLQDSFKALGLKTDVGASTRDEYDSPISKELIPYVRGAELKNALTVFGKNLDLDATITRGEAIVFLSKMLGLTSNKKVTAYTDVKGADMQNAVKVALEKKWISAGSSRAFGVSRSLTKREATTLLKRVSTSSKATVEKMPRRGDVPVINIKVNSKEVAPVPQNDLLQAVWQLLNNQYLYKEKIDNKEAGYKAAEGLVNSLNDPYTTFMRPVDAQQFQETIEGEISGIGAQVEYRDNALFIVAPISGSPAMKAGLKPGDVITAVDGQSLAGLTLVKAVEKVRGPKGTTVKLTITRDGSTLEISVTRDTVRMPEIDISYQGDIAIVKLVQFGQTTDRELRGLLQKVEEQNPKGLILDLRNNPGGLLHAAEIVLSNFLPKGSGVADIRSAADSYLEVTADEPTIGSDVTMVVLVNKGSASASEIVAGSLQDHKRATIMGETTFGKGTVQQIIEFRDGSSMKMTIAEWFTPKGRQINGKGIDPDVVVTAADGRDEQLLRAIDSLR